MPEISVALGYKKGKPLVIKSDEGKITIKTCPFCGGSPEFLNFFGYQIKCVDCGMGTPSEYGAWYDKTINKWNARAQ